MSTADTIKALVSRGIAKKDAEKLAKAGYTLGTLKKANLKQLKKLFPETKANSIIGKLTKKTTKPSESQPEKAGKKPAKGKPEKAGKKPAKSKPKKAGRKPVKGKSEKAGRKSVKKPKIKIVIPPKIPALGPTEQMIQDRFTKMDLEIPRRRPGGR